VSIRPKPFTLTITLNKGLQLMGSDEDVPSPSRTKFSQGVAAYTAGTYLHQLRAQVIIQALEKKNLSDE
jgi:hypothetical protein